MFDLDLAAIGLEYIGILYGHCFNLGDDKSARSFTVSQSTHPSPSDSS
jgi:hypothetical protein